MRRSWVLILLALALVAAISILAILWRRSSVGCAETEQAWLDRNW